MAILPNIIGWDLETGGLEAEEHQITEIGMVACDARTLKKLGEYHTFVRPYSDELSITPKALEKSGVTMADIVAGAEAKLVLKQLAAFAKEYRTKARFNNKPILMGHNVLGFDRKFFEKFFSLHNQNMYDHFSAEYVDTLPLSRIIWGNSKDDVTSWRLGVVCERAGIKLKNAHSALNDAQANVKLFQFMVKLMRGNLDKVSADQTEENTHTHRPFQM